tara:strand:- start:6247 stop:8628 length:2382 start_codon:yes stop_codon:yes gene_type:complete
MTLSHLKFRTRLLIAFSIVFVLFGGAMYISFQKLNDTKKILSDLYNFSLTINKSVNDIYSDAIKVHHELEELVHEENKENIAIRIKEVKELDENIHKKFKVISYHFKGNKKDVEKAHNTFKEWKNTQNYIIQLKINNKNSEAEEVLENKCAKQAGAVFKDLLLLSDISKKWADQSYFNNLNEIEQKKEELLWILLFILFASLVVAVLVSRSISVPIRKLVKKIERNHQFKGENSSTKSRKSEQELLTLAVDELDALSTKLEDFNKNLQYKVNEATSNLRESKERYILAVGASNMGIWDWNLPTKNIYFSAVWKKQLGYKENELENSFKTYKQLLHPNHVQRVFKELKEYIKNPVGKFKSDFKFKHKNGNYIWIQSTAEALKDEQDKTTRLFGMHRDITKYVLHEKTIQKQYTQLQIAKDKAEESDRLKTEFLNNMSHEIRTPMNGILGFSNLLANPELTNEKREVFVSIIQNSGSQLLQIIDDILEISRLGTKQVKVLNEEVCLNDVLFELFSVFDIKAKENKTPLYLKKELSDKKSTILTDKTKLNKIVSNLLENALKFTSEGFVEMGYQLLHNELKIYVKDTGIGIDKNKQQLIFERFSQAEKELSKNTGGLGLGLSIAKENAELLGGEIIVESIKGKGTTFYINIPYNPVFKNIETGSEIIEPKYTLLIVEDEEINYLHLETLLVAILKLDCLILHAKNGKEAVEICKNNTTIDLIFMDIKMPIMDGYEATKKIRKFLPNIPIIAQTAYSTKEEEKEAIEAGCTYFISKPINKDSLINVIQNQLKEINKN